MTPPPVAAAGLPSLPVVAYLRTDPDIGTPTVSARFLRDHPEFKSEYCEPLVKLSDALAAIAAQQQPRIPARVTIADARDYLNTNDKAFWVTGWNECVESMLASAPQPPQQAGPETEERCQHGVRWENNCVLCASVHPASDGEIQGDLAACDRGGVTQWQPIETAPKDGAFLVFMPTEREGKRIQPMIRRKNFGTIGDRFDFDCETPTHWMPLPAAPTGEGA